MSYIYKITNDKNGKIYIGKTEHLNPENRWKEHLRDYKKERCEKRPLYEAMNKYGIEHFRFEVIEETDNAEEREKYWINKLRTYVGFKDCCGYNATLGGDGKSYLKLNEESVIKYHIEESVYIISDTAKHFNVDIRTIKKILKKHNLYWMNSCWANKLKFFLKNKGVIQIDINSKKIVNKYESAITAEKETGIHQKCITNACINKNGKYVAGGFLWCYGKDLDKIISNGFAIEDKLV